ncbi:Fur family transcriptional regulator [Paenibacillus turpanensis]|uniref:Fur family transcriptional regulator n=1 Tax=Paenibacillus turpanensis TaxID=2689078 RepID=UPI00140E5F6B|nr:Fur family transcriptional regulator [Paenibacillus turpanensis]
MTERKLQSILRQLEIEGLRITSQRKMLIRILIEQKGFLQTRELYEQMNRMFPGVSYDTIYRNIRMMRDVGVVEQFDFDDGVKFKIACRTHHHHHLICLGCSKITPLPFCPMTMIKVPSSFTVVSHKFEVYGYCRRCAGKQEKKEKLQFDLRT